MVRVQERDRANVVETEDQRFTQRQEEEEEDEESGKKYSRSSRKQVEEMKKCLQL